jgi:hypothetical protein
MSDDRGSEYSGDAVVAGVAWRAFCDRLARLGERILEPDFPAGPHARAEGFRHLATQTVAWLSWAVGYPDAEFPAFFRQNDLVIRWGGPSVDQTTRRARVAPDGVYTIAGHMGACEDFILTLKNGDMHEGKYGILAEVTGSELGLRAGDEVSITVSASEVDGAASDHWIALPADATMLNIREYYFDWRPLPPALFTIQRIDTAGTARPPLEPAQVGRMLDTAATMLEHSITYWNEWMEEQRARVVVNVLSAPGGTAGGSSRIVYGFGFFDLADDEAWLIETDAPDADAFDFQLYSLAWFETLDFPNRVTSRNHTQTVTDADGRIRLVVSHHDPGVANWIDTEGRREAMLTYRWIKARSTPTPVARVVKLADLDRELPSDTVRVDAAARREEIRRRQAHIAWRYRT